MKPPRWLAGRPADPPPAEPAYAFSSDWFSGNIYLFERHLLHLRDTPCRILEIGSYEGRSAIWMLDRLATHPEAAMTCVDAHMRPALPGNIEKTCRSTKVTLRHGKSRDILGGLAKSDFDFIYIDGSHEKVDVLEDAVLSFRLAKAGAVLAFDDYLEDGPEWNARDFAKPAIDAFLDIYASRIELLEQCHQVWIRKLADELPD